MLRYAIPTRKMQSGPVANVAMHAKRQTWASTSLAHQWTPWPDRKTGGPYPGVPAWRTRNKAESSPVPVYAEKAVEGQEGEQIGLIVEKGPDEGTVGDAGPEPSTPLAPVASGTTPKKAGVDSFIVAWSKNAKSSPTRPSFRLDYRARFRTDADHDPALAEFRQNAMTTYEVTSGPNKGLKGSTAPLHDDNYSRADDVVGHTKSDPRFVSNDNPSCGPWDKEDVLTYSFTAEQMIVDTSDGNKVIAKRGPHTATAQGKDPRTFTGVPAKLA